MQTNQRAQKGFTLIEVLVAVGIMAIVLSILLKSEISTVSLSARNNLELKALPIAVSEMDEIRTMELDGEYSQNRDPFRLTAVQALYPGSAVPIDVTTLKVFYGDTENAELKTFKIKFF